MAINELRTYMVGCDDCGDQVIVTAADLTGVLPTIADMGWSAQSRLLLCGNCVAAVSARC